MATNTYHKFNVGSAKAQLEVPFLGEILFTGSDRWG